MKLALRLVFLFSILFLQVGCSTFSRSSENTTTAPAPVEDKSLISTNPYAAIGKKSPIAEITRSSKPVETLPQNEVPSLRLEEIKEPTVIPTPNNSQQQNNSKWIWPTDNQIMRKFDSGSNETRGLDFTGKVGDAIRVVHSGKVVFSGTGLKGYGQLIIVKHDNNLLTAYAHNHSLLVKEGELVEAGQVIAEMGLNEKTGIPMLHFEVRFNGKPVDPLNYLPNRY